MMDGIKSRWNWPLLAWIILVAGASMASVAAKDEPIRARQGKPMPRGSVDFSVLERQERQSPRVGEKAKVKVRSHGRPYGRAVPVGGLEDGGEGQDARPTGEGKDGQDARPTLESAQRAESVVIEPTAEATPPTTASFGALLDNGLAGTFNPDTQGAVGPNHLMVALNTEVRIQDRNGGVIQTVSLDGFWASIGASNVFDPRLVYDPYGGRWIMSAEADPAGNNPLVLVGVSRSSDPTGLWNLYSVDIDEDAPRYAESPNLGFNRNWIVVQADLFNSVDFGFETSDLFVFTKAELYNNGPGNYRVISLNTTNDVATHVPAATYDPDLNTLYVMANYNGNAGGSGFLETKAITGAIGNEEIATVGFHEGPAWADFVPDFVHILPQLGTARKILTGDARLANVVYRDGTLFTTHNIFAPTTSPTRAGVQWWEVSPAGRIPKQVGRLIDPANVLHYGFPSIAVNRDLDVMLGFNRFWAERYVSAYYVWRAVTDTPNTMRPIQGTTNIVKLGEAPYIKTNSYGDNVWGDWSATVVDPVNDTEMWTLQEYAAPQVGGQSRWGTWWARVTPDVDLAIAGTAAPTTVVSGGNVTYTLQITNLFENRVDGVRLTNTLPPNASFVSANASQGSCSHAGGVVVCDLGRMEDLATATVTIVAAPFNVGQSVNVAQIWARGPDIGPADNTASLVVTVNPSADAGVVLSAGPNPVHVGNNLTATVTVTNGGPSAATSVVVTNEMPASATFVSATPSVGTFVRTGQNVVWTVGNVAVGATPTLTIVMRPTAGGMLTNRAVLRATSVDTRPANDSAVHVVRANALPVLSPILNRTISEDTVTTVAFTIGDAETPLSALGLVISSSNQGLVPDGNLALTRNGANCSLTITPLPNQFGSTVISRTLTDADGGAVTLLFTNSVSAVNDPPTLDAIGDVTVGEDSGAQAVGLTGITGGPPNEPQAPTVTATSSAPGIVPNPSVTAVSGGNATLTFTPVANAFGTVVITVNVNDGGASNNIMTRTFNVNVLGVNDAPQMNQPANITLSEDAPQRTVNLTGISAGNASESDTLTITAAQTNPALLSDLTVSYTGGTAGTLTFNTVPNAFGSSEVTLTVNDNMPSNNIITRAFTVNVSPVNDAPAINALANLAILEDAGLQTVSMSGIGSGAANEDQTITVTAGAGGAPLIGGLSVNYTSPSATGTLTFQTPVNANGSANVTVTVRDDGASNNVTTQTFSVTVASVNDAPTLNPIAPLSIPEDSAQQRIMLTGISEGAGNESAQTISFSAVSSDPSIIPHPTVLYTNGQATASLRFTPVADAHGTATVTVTGTDSGGTANGGQDTVTQALVVTVTPINDLPSITAIANRTISEDVVTNIGFQIGDLETLPGQLDVTVVSTHPTLLPASGLVLSGSGTDRVVQVTPAADQFGTVTNRITVTDADNGSRTEEFVLTVSPVNDPPTVNGLTPLIVDEDSGTQTVMFSGVSGGPSNEPQNVTVIALSSAPSLIPTPTVSYTNGQSTGVLQFTPAPNLSGIATLTLRVTDGAASNNVTERTFQVTVREVNDSPAISAIPNQTMLEDDVRMVSFTITDSDTPIGSLVLSAQSFNEELVASGDLSFTGTGTDRTLIIRPLPEQSGAGSIMVTVTDGSSPVTATFELVVNPVNDPPTVSAVPNQTMNEGATRTVFFTVSDVETPEGNLQVTVDSSNTALFPAGSLVLGQTSSNRSLTINATGGRFGAATINIRASDGQTNFTRSFTVTVIDAEPPVVTAISDITIDEDTGTGPVAFAISDRGNPVSILTLAGQSSNQGLIPNGNIVFGGTGFNRTVSITPAANQFGSAQITISVGDGVNTTQRTFLVTVRPANDPPTLRALNPVTIAEDAGLQTVPLNDISAGAANESQIVTITASSSNPSLIPAVNVSYVNPAATGSLTFTPAANANGSATITVTVSDGQSVIIRTFTVTVNPAGDPPTISTIANIVTSEEVPVTTGFTIGDPDTPLMNVTVTGVSTNTALVANTNIHVSGHGTARTVTIVPSPDQFGVTRITLTVNDGSGTATTSFLVTVGAVNDPPTLSPLTNRFYNVSPGTVTLPLSGITSGSGNESDTISVTLAVSDSTLPFQTAPIISYASPNQAGSLSFRPQNNQSGSATITITVNDNRGSNNITRRSFLLSVKPSNNALPTISPISNASTPEDTPVTIPFTVGDSQTAVGSLVLSALSLNESVIPSASIVFGGSGANRTATFTPAPHASGSAMIVLTVQDSNFGGTNRAFTLTVTPANDSPEISPINNLSVAEDTSTDPIPFTVRDVETPAGNLTVTATSANTTLVPNGNISLGGSGTNRALLITPAANQSGSAQITVTVNDGTTPINSIFTLTVSPANDAPAISTIGDQTIAEDTATAALPFTISDPETAAGSLTVGANSSNQALVPNSGIAIAGSGANRTVTVTPLPNQFGLSTITVTVGDGGNSAPSAFVVNVVPANDAPTLDPIANVSLTPGGNLNVNLTGITSGAGNEVQGLLVSASSSNPDLISHPVVSYTSPNSSGSLALTAQGNSNGTVAVTVTVNDGQTNNSAVTRTFNVNVTAGGTLPLLQITRQGANVSVSWPADSGDYVLQRSGRMGLGWVSVAAAATVVGGRNVISEPASQAARFYRLGLRSQVSSAALLEIRSEGANVVLSWPADAGNYALERASTFGGTWAEVTSTPSVVSGWNVLAEPRGAVAGFYRLRRR